MMNNVVKTTAIFFLIMLLYGCRKVKLEGEVEALVGKWLHIYTIREEVDKYGVYYDTLYFTDTYQVEFIKKGRVKFYKNGIVVKNEKIKTKRKGLARCQFESS